MLVFRDRRKLEVRSPASWDEEQDILLISSRNVYGTEGWRKAQEIHPEWKMVGLEEYLEEMPQVVRYFLVAAAWDVLLR